MRSSFRSKRKSTGGLYNRFRKKKKRDLARDFSPPRIGETKVKTNQARGSITKRILFQGNDINVTDPSTKKTTKSKILTVKENPANLHFVRMNVITKGATVETEMGTAKITSRPGQEGIVNAVLLKK